ncbi:MAG TPA: helix-turn-helix domain-containing protein, partial [Chloroflexota bacterium]|nr:helix-turn-helix domain-containing protein [Chloroflexota bacterium]
MNTSARPIALLENKGQPTMVLLDEDYLSVQEAAAQLKVSKSTIRRWIAAGALPAYRVGRRRVALKRADVATLITPARQHTERGDVMATSGRQSVRALTAAEQQQARAAVAAAKQLQAQLQAHRGGKQFSPSWELLNALRDER